MTADRTHGELFRQPWWLDATAGAGGWGEVCVREGGRTVASLQYALRRRWGMTTLSMPPLTPVLGPCFGKLDGKVSQILAREKDLTESLHAQLPRHDYFAQNFSANVTNWLPWYWLGYSQTTRYTYTLDLTQDEATLWAACLPKVRSDVRKAATRFAIAVKTDLGLDAFIGVQNLTFSRKRVQSPLRRSLIERVDAACAERGCRRIFLAADGAGRVHAGVYLVWDSTRAYYLMGGGDPNLRNSGATSLALWEAIRFARTVAPVFDFEGSMMEPVERFIRGFGATQVPYLRVWRAPGRLTAAALGIRIAVRPFFSARDA
jgi:hypothetical protein